MSDALKALAGAGLSSSQIRRLAHSTSDQREVRQLAANRSAAGAQRRAARTARETAYNRALAMEGSRRQQAARPKPPAVANPGARIPRSTQRTPTDAGPWGPLLGSLNKPKSRYS